ncbi:MAG: 30S ribosomal protein S14 [Candidatus ainarchaeum sp.]|nr:30S ribosomal protein S14 [Candidatus ainarchaeum sp.]
MNKNFKKDDRRDYIPVKEKHTLVIVDKHQKKKVGKRNNDKVCKICGTRKGFVSKYGLNICRRCFKDNAKRLGFKKFD